MTLSTCLLWLSILCCSIIPVLSAPEYRLFFGRITGVDKFAEGSNSLYYAYYGIPYANPPIGSLRFKAPTRYTGNGPADVISTNAVRTACMQPSFSPTFVMSEDCLYLNIYVPSTPVTNTPKQVMVYIHGGGFIAGDVSEFTPSRLVTERDVIVVTFTYRLGVFGFLNSGTGDGNYALQDQMFALKWVQENIGQFGGNPNDVTIFGNSAGAVSASLLSISPKAKGLFNKVILQSGTALNSRVFANHPEKQFDKLAKATGCLPWFYPFSQWWRSKFIGSITECMRGLPAQQLFGAAFSRGGPRSTSPKYSEGFGEDSDIIYSPAIDGEVIPKHPEILMNDKRYLREVGALDRSFIIGFNNNEALLMAEMYFNMGGNVSDMTTVEEAERHLSDVLDDHFRFGPPEKFRAVAKYEYLYPRMEGRVPLQGLLNILMDYVFVMPGNEFARKLKTADSQTKVFMYLLDYYPALKDPSTGVKGFSHAMELAYLFDSHPWLRQYDYYTTVPDPQGRDSAIYTVMQGAWTQFAKTGSPDGYIQFQSSPWPEFDLTDQSYLAINQASEVRQHMYAKRMALWTELFRTVYY